MRMSDQTDMVKVELRDPPDRVETLWATPVGPDRYKLDNSPLYAYGVSWQDVIEARPERDGELPTLVRVLEKSGNRTIRLVLDPPADQSDESKGILDWLVELGCSYEGANPGFISINVPPEVELETVCDSLDSAELQWEHGDPSDAELYPDEEQ